VVGAITALFAATIAVAQNDIKKVLAYSTVSQLGYMFLAVGSGAYVAAIFHMVTHAFFKACCSSAPAGAVTWRVSSACRSSGVNCWACSAPFYDFLAPVLGHATMRAGVPHSAELLLMLVAVAVALAGIALAWAPVRPQCQGGAARGQAAASSNPLHKLVSQRLLLRRVLRRRDRALSGLVVQCDGAAARVWKPALAEGSMATPSRSGPAASRWFARLQSATCRPISFTP
jgi:hypothetical protein